MLVRVASLKAWVGLEIHVQGALSTSWQVGAGCGQDTLVPYCVTAQETARELSVQGPGFPQKQWFKGESVFLWPGLRNRIVSLSSRCGHYVGHLGEPTFKGKVTFISFVNICSEIPRALCDTWGAHARIFLFPDSGKAGLFISQLPLLLVEDSGWCPEGRNEWEYGREVVPLSWTGP